MPDSIIARPRDRRANPLAITAAAQLYPQYAGGSGASQSYLSNFALDDELWGFYDSLGEYAAFVDWMARAMSRVRLGCAEAMPGADEPAMLDGDEPGVQLMNQFYGGVAGQAAFMEAMTPQLLVPGQGYLVPERFDPSVPLVLANWSVQSTKTFRDNSAMGAQVMVAPGRWRELLPDALPVRVWIPNPQFPYMARSPAQAALPIMRRLDLLDKRIVSELLSRLVMNGLLWIPQEGQLPKSAAFQDQPDPFFAELIDIASRNIRTPGSALAAIPFPVRFQGDLIEKIKLMKFAEPFDEQLLAERDKELSRLAQSLPLSKERQEGFADANHWNGSIVSEDDITTSIKPVAEIIANCVTVGFLQPLLAVAGQQLVGPNGGKLLAWPDYSELTARPDKSAATLAAYDRGEASGTALRRESGLDESDKPTPPEQAEMIMLKAARDPGSTVQPAAVEKLTGLPVPVAPESPAASGAVGPADIGAPARVSQPDAAGSNASDEAMAAAAFKAFARVNGHSVNGSSRAK